MNIKYPESHSLQMKQLLDFFNKSMDFTSYTERQYSNNHQSDSTAKVDTVSLDCSRAGSKL